MSFAFCQSNLEFMKLAFRRQFGLFTLLNCAFEHILKFVLCYDVKIIFVCIILR
jgi:hypothetical protein